VKNGDDEAATALGRGGAMKRLGPSHRLVRRLAQAGALVAMIVPPQGCFTPGFLGCLLSGHPQSPECRASAAAPGAPSAPTGVEATVTVDILGGRELRVTWNENPEPDVAATQASGPFDRVNGRPVTVSDYLDDDLPSTEFFYLVTAIDDRLRESFASAVVSATPIGADLAPAVPTGLAASPRVGAVQLLWDDNGELDLAGYNVYRAAQPAGPFNRRNTALVTAAEYLDMPVSAEIPSFFRVTAVDAAGQESDPSAVVLGTACPPIGCAPSSLRSARPGAGGASRGSFAFELALSGRPVGAGSARLDGDAIRGSGYTADGTFELTVSGRPGAFARTWRAASEWRLDPGAGTAGATGIVLATFADPQQGVACLRFDDAYTVKARGKTPRVAARGTFTLLGGTGAAAALLGRGHYSLGLGADGTLTYKGTGRPPKQAPPDLPAECAGLR
jgi:hypothetical protein